MNKNSIERRKRAHKRSPIILRTNAGTANDSFRFILDDHCVSRGHITDVSRGHIKDDLETVVISDKMITY